MRQAFILTAALATGEACQGCGPELGPVIVQTPAGALQGKSWEPISGVPTAAFLGIPYATQQRFVEATPVGSWEGIRSAEKAGPACPQQATIGLLLEDIDEDCLSANVFAPASVLNNTEAGLPVMFWIHGGGLTVGSSYTQALGKMFNAFNIEAIYDGQRLAGMGNVVVVSANYRLGILGYQPFGDSATNLGFKDQQEALRWTQHMAPSFGGDPAKVMIFGESAGGESVLFHLASPASAGLFRGAICQSGGTGASSPDDAAKQAGKFADKLGCGQQDMLTCLKNAPVADILKAQGGMGSVGAIKGTEELPDDEDVLFAAGEFNQVPLVIGSNRDEPTIFGACAKITADQFRQGVAEEYGDQAKAVLEVYPVEEYPAPRDALVELSADQIFCENRNSVNLLVGHGVPTFRYLLNHSAWWFGAMSKVLYPGETDYCFGVPHAADLVDVWGTFTSLFDGSAGVKSPGDLALSHQVMQAWTNFAHTLNPNNGPMGTLSPEWSQHTDGNDETFVLDTSSTGTTSQSVPDRVSSKCAALLPGSALVV